MFVGGEYTAGITSCIFLHKASVRRDLSAWGFNQYCEHGLILDSARFDGFWLIPAETEKLQKNLKGHR